MPSLREQQQRFAEALLSSADVAPRIACAGADAAQRLAIYRNNVFSNYRQALRASYPVVCRLVGSVFFETAVDAFVHAQPSISGDLHGYGGEFGDFLARYPYAQDLRYLPDVARLEWAIDEIQRAADHVHAPERVLDALASTAGELLGSIAIDLDPSCRLVASWFPVLHVWRVNQPEYSGDLHVDLDEGPDRLILRRNRGTVVIEPLDLASFRWLRWLQAGHTLGQAYEAAQVADAAFDLGAALRVHIAAGTITRIVAPPVR